MSVMWAWHRHHVSRCLSLYCLYKSTNNTVDIVSKTGRRFCHKTTKFRTINGAVDSKSPVYKKNLERNSLVVEKFQSVLRFATAGGNAKAVDRHVNKNKKLLVHDRLTLLFDNADEILELAPLAGMGMPYGDIPRAGMICAIGKVCDIHCLVVANDATVKAGTMYPISVKKQLHCFHISHQNRLPCIYVVDSGGAYLPMQADIFVHGGRSFYNEAILNSENIPQLAVVCGSCTAGAAYVPTMAQEAIIVNKIGTIFLAGPPLVQAALGEVVSPEDLGGAAVHCKTSGCTDYFAATEEEAFEMSRASVAAFNIEPVTSRTNVLGPVYDPDQLLGLISADNVIDSYKVIARIVDNSELHEFKAVYGRDIITGFCHVNGYLVGLVANNGPITGDAALKASHFIQLCSQRNLPIIFLQNISPDKNADFDIDRLRNQAKFMSSVACAGVPIVTVVIGNSYGAESYMMGGRCMNPRFMFCWPNAKVCMVEPEHLAQSLMKTEMLKLHRDELNVSQVAQLYKSLLDKCHQQASALHSSAEIWNDGIILPQHTRKTLGQCLEIIHQNPQFTASATSSTMSLKSVLRM